MGNKVGTYQDGEMTIFNQGLYEQSAIQKHRLGTIRRLNDGRVYVYALAGAVALAPGKVTMAAAVNATIQSEVVAANAAVGDDHVHVTNGANTLFNTVNAFKDGYFWTDDAAAGGDVYKIRGHAAFGSAAAGVINLYDKIRVAITTSNTWSAIKEIQSGVLIADTTPSSAITGVPNIDVTAAYYFWNQVKGPCVVLGDGTLVVGTGVCLSNGTGGAVEAYVPATSLDPSLGQCLSVSANTLYSLINLSIPGY
jgi:hypothetical protein